MLFKLYRTGTLNCCWLVYPVRDLFFFRRRPLFRSRIFVVSYDACYAATKWSAINLTRFTHKMKKKEYDGHRTGPSIAVDGMSRMTHIIFHTRRSHKKGKFDFLFFSKFNQRHPSKWNVGRGRSGTAVQRYDNPEKRSACAHMLCKESQVNSQLYLIPKKKKRFWSVSWSVGQSYEAAGCVNQETNDDRIGGHSPSPSRLQCGW